MSQNAIQHGLVRLADYPPTIAELHVWQRSGWNRALRAATLALLLPPAALIAFLIPPHGEPLFLVVFGGLYLVYREATTRYVVGSFSGTCPRCRAALLLKRGSRLTVSRSIPCYGCHFHVRIEMEPRAAAAMSADSDTPITDTPPSRSPRDQERGPSRSSAGTR